MPVPLLPSRFLFRFAAPCRRRSPLWTPEGAGLDETYRLAGLAELEAGTGKGGTSLSAAKGVLPPLTTPFAAQGVPPSFAQNEPVPFFPLWADVRAAWSEEGLMLAVCVQGKKETRRAVPVSLPENRDGLHVWIDTRDVHNVHRAGRFCHQFFFSPGEGVAGAAGEKGAEGVKGVKGGRRKAEGGILAVAEWLPINRAREQPRPVRPGSLQARCQPRADGYLLEALIPAEALTGFDPAEHPRLGFTYAVIDRELGEQTLGVGSPMPYQEDPSLWATLELIG